jgi:sirohydrochlorin cobaltochelatase
MFLKFQKNICWVITFIIIILTISTASAENIELKTKAKDSAIVLAAFGASYENAQKALVNIKEMAEKKFPENKVTMSFSSNIIRKILAKRGQFFDSPDEAVKKLKDKGYKRIIIQSLQIIPGTEYELLIELKGKYNDITVGAPLLSSYDEMMKVLRLAINEVSSSRKPNEAIILVGHGTGHPADLSYIAAANEIKNIDRNAFLCTVEGHITFKDIVAECIKAGIKKAHIIPFMSVAGDHAHNDMYGEEPESLKSMLKERGIQSEMVMKGLGENKEVAQIWIDHLEQAMDSRL